MYPSLYYLIKDLIGIDITFLKIIHTFGFLVALAFIGCAWTLYLEFKRKEESGLLHSFPKKVWVGEKASLMELLSNGFLGFIIGFKIIEAVLDFNNLLSNPQHFILSFEGNILGGILVGGLFIWLKYREKEKQRLPKPELKTFNFFPHQMVSDITVVAAICGFLGAKLFHNLEYFNDFKADPIGALISFSGLTFYGGLIFGFLGVVYYTARYKINFKHLIDSAAPGLMLAYGIGRIGCHLAGDGDWGIENLAAKPDWMGFLPDWLWAYNYPNNVISAGIPIPGCDDVYCFALENGVFPTPLYESVICIALFGLLWYLRKKINIAGVLFFVYLILNGIERYFIQQIRVESVNPDAQYHIFGYHIAQAELISALLILIGIAGTAFLILQNKRKKYA